MGGLLLSSLGTMAGAGMTPEQFSRLDRLRQQIEPPTTLQDPLEVADREEELADWLVTHGVEQPWDIAADLATAGVGRDWCDRAAAELGPDVLAPSLRWVASTIRAVTLLTEVRESTRRVSELVAAIKSYSQMDRGSLQSVDVRQGLESTLLILAPKLRGGVVVERHLADDLPPIEAYEGELNQVWTNLVDNAVDAMDGTGTSDSRRVSRVRRSSSRWPTRGRGCRPRWSRGRSRRSTRPSRSARARVSASTSLGASSWTDMVASSRWTPSRAAPCSACGCRSDSVRPLLARAVGAPGYQPRSRQSLRCGRSTPSVLSSP